MTAQKLMYEDRWGPIGAALYRTIIPAGLVGLIVLALPLIWVTSIYLFGLYPVLVGGVAYASWRNVTLSQGAARLVAGTLGALLTMVAALLAIGFFIGSGGV